MELKGKLSIGRPSGGAIEEKVVRIEVTDERSGIRFLLIEIPIGDFAECLMGLSFVPCNLELRGLQNVGKIRETKTEKVPALNRYSPTKEEIKAALAPYEVDGWIGDGSYLTNHHYIKNDIARVPFSRFVDAEEEV